MGRKRTTVFADEDDLAVLRASAARRGVPEAELIREAVHLAALAERRWDEPFFTQTFTPVSTSTLEGPHEPADVRAIRAAQYDEQAARYQDARNPPT